ncbi:MAG: hypothetical protein IK137_02375 [Bacilli bacterium]|nr:hypothetical protein [Bacilli bacterium]
MSAIIEFNKKEKIKLIEKCTQAKRIGDGYESICYQIDDYVYKVLNNHFNTTYDEKSIYNDEIDLKSFLFPEEIYIYDNKIFASKTRYMRNEISERRLHAGILPNIDKIKDALVPFIEDIYKLSENNILTVDMAWRNLIFDGENLYAIDTLHYTKIEEHYQMNAYQWNISKLQRAIFDFATEYENVCKKKKIPLNEEKIEKLHGLAHYINNVAKQVEKDNTEERIQKIKR